MAMPAIRTPRQGRRSSRTPPPAAARQVGSVAHHARRSSVSVSLMTAARPRSPAFHARRSNSTCPGWIALQALARRDPLPPCGQAPPAPAPEKDRE
jgi:hypothetical protein